VKFLTTLISAMSAPSTEGSVRAMVRLSAIVVVTVIAFSAGFHWLMELEGREFTWLTSFYWTMVTMTTLGYGDIVFESDLGRMYSLVVLLVGAILILVMLPFVFIQLVYLPWQQATRLARAPRVLPDDLAGHVILTRLDPMNEALIARLRAADKPYVLLEPDADEAVRLHDAGYRVAVGQLDDPQTYRNIGAERAAMLFTAGSDTANTNAAFTMREVTDRGLVVATANSADAVDILELAGCDRVLQLGDLLGEALARRILAPSARSSAISAFEDLVIAETSAGGTELVGCSLNDLDLRERFGVSVVGLWDRGTLQLATPDLVIEARSILLLAGTEEQLGAYDVAFAPPPGRQHAASGHVVIVGGGRVGRATARSLLAAGTSCRIIEKLPERVQEGLDYVMGDAADLSVLQEAGIEQASAVVVTTHDDDMNLYLTLYCRRLRPEAEILGRVNLDRNLSTMHRAGADFVLSYASMGANEAWNALRVDASVLLAEGLVVFRVPVPDALAGRTLRETDIPAETGCSVIGIMRPDGCRTDLDPDAPLPADADLVLVGDDIGEVRFLGRYVGRRRTQSAWRRLLPGGA
jgi:voltage-gated potassium channel